MPKIAKWDSLPEGIRQHLTDRMRDRGVSVEDLNRLRLWMETDPELPEGSWFKDFGSFKLCGEGYLPKTFLSKGQATRGTGL